jgi:hypothetical protein
MRSAERFSSARERADNASNVLPVDLALSGIGGQQITKFEPACGIGKYTIGIQAVHDVNGDDMPITHDARGLRFVSALFECLAVGEMDVIADFSPNYPKKSH